jgi:exopolyphosphatase/guanosine-5'-triphosphate,3'-diphosphate pyrophosphatase
MRVGVIDVGTNSVRVLVAESENGRIRDLDRDLVITRLGEGVDREGTINPEALRRTVAAIAGYAERCRARDTHAIRIIATSAVRDAANRDDFTSAVRRATGIDPVLLSGDQEAQLGFLGATLDLSAPPPYLVVDIGGGSTELVRGTARAERFISLDIGSVRLTERHIRSDPPTQDEIDAVAADADEHLEEAARAIGDDPGGTLVGLAGTITTATAIALELPGYDRDAIHHARLTRATIAEVKEKLGSMKSEERRALPAMPRGREDVIVAGVIILERILARFSFDECLVSEADILDGTAVDFLRTPDRAAATTDPPD